MDLSYYTGGEPCSAAGMNTDFEEADRRTALALDNHCLPYLIGEDQNITLANLGLYFSPRRFIWKAGAQRLTGYFGAHTYNHAHFPPLAAAATPNTSLPPYYSVTEKWLKVNPNIPTPPWAAPGSRTCFHWSLARHTKLFTPPGGIEEPYRLIETQTNPVSPLLPNTVVNIEFIRSLEQAELFFEGVTDLDFDGAWDKYNFFRVHNCNVAELTIRFRNTAGAVAHTLTVPACGSKCLRRTGVNGTYTEGFKYFHRFLPGDTRDYQQSSGLYNNITNPSLLIPFINHVLGGIPHSNGVVVAPPTVWLDPTVRAPLPEAYAELFGDVTDDETLAGDGCHHAGIIQSKVGNVITEIAFDGYADIIAAPPAGLITQLVGSTLQIKASDPAATLISLSTNFLGTGAGQKFFNNPVVGGPNKAIRSGAAFSNVDGHLPAPLIFKSFSETTAFALHGDERSITWTDPDGVPHTVTTTQPLIVPDALATFAALTLRSPLGDFKTALQGAGAALAPTFALTASGLIVKGTQTIALTAPISPKLLGNGANDPAVDNEIFRLLQLPVIPVLSKSVVNGLTLRAKVASDGTSFSLTRAVMFNDYGFPNVDAWLYTGFLTPRHGRIYFDITNPAAASHPDFVEGLANANGHEVDYQRPTQKIVTGIKILSPWNQPNFLPTFNNVGRGMIAGMMRTDGPNDGNSPRDGLYQAHVGGALNGGQGLAVRMRMNVEHRNNLAAKVNSIVRYRPLNFLDHFVFQRAGVTTSRLRFPRPNERGILDDLALGAPAGNAARPFWTGYPYFNSGGQAAATAYRETLNYNYHGLRPKTQYCSFGPGDRPVVADEFEASNSYVSQIMEQATALGIPIKTQADLPQWDLIATKRRRSLPTFVDKECSDDQTITLVNHHNHSPLPPLYVGFHHTHPINPGAYTGIEYVEINHELTLDLDFNDFADGLDWDELDDLCRPDLNGITNYRWLDAEDIKTVAAALGYKFAHVIFGPRFDLKVVDVEGFQTLPGTAPVSQVVNLLEKRTYPGEDFDQTVVWPTDETLELVPIESVKVTLDLALEGRTLEFLPAEDGAWITGCDNLAGARDQRMSIHVQTLGADVPRMQGNYQFKIEVPDWPDEVHELTGGVAAIGYHTLGNPVFFEYLWPAPPAPPPDLPIGGPSVPPGWVYTGDTVFYYDPVNGNIPAWHARTPDFAVTWTRTRAPVFKVLAGNLHLTLNEPDFAKFNWAKFWSASARNPADYAKSPLTLQRYSYLVTETQPEPVVVISAGWTTNLTVITTPVPAVAIASEYSLEGEDEAQSVRTRGPNAFPCTVEPGAGTRVQILADLTMPA